MQDFVTKETAIRLKEKGFPQPDKSFGQVWYLLHVEQPILVGSALGFELDKYPCVFAPRATDILQHIGKDHYLCAAKDGFVLLWGEIGREVETVCFGDNPAEVMAETF
jgi:hypothetical protein